MKIAVELEPAEADAKTLSQGIVNFNRTAIPDLEPIEAEVRFHVIARDDGGTVLGGLRAACYWNTLHIELLWIAEAARGTGLGHRIISDAEAYAVQNGCGKALVETTSWQAKPFYEKNGYALMATLTDRPKGHASHYLAKSLAAD